MFVRRSVTPERARAVIRWVITQAYRRIRPVPPRLRYVAIRRHAMLKISVLVRHVAISTAVGYKVILIPATRTIRSRMRYAAAIVTPER